MADRLVFSDDHAPGISRKRRGKGFSFHLPSGDIIRDASEVARLRAVALPPAYRRCWFCPDPDGHIQATGYDARGRKQYRYHPAFRADQEAGKFARCAAFGAALPAMRARIERAMRGRAVTQERTLAAMVRLLDVGLLRIGNECYARENGSYGVSTLRKRHARIESGMLRLDYRAKSGKQRELRLRDAALLRFVRAMQDLPGQHLFQYLDALGQRHEVGSSEVNAFIAETMGQGFSAKHFRTWGGTLVAFEAWRGSAGAIGMTAALETVAEALGNTPAISRKSYVHPLVIAAIKAGPVDPASLPPRPRATRWMSRDERALLAFLKDGEA